MPGVNKRCTPKGVQTQERKNQTVSLSAQTVLSLWGLLPRRSQRRCCRVLYTVVFWRLGSKCIECPAAQGSPCRSSTLSRKQGRARGQGMWMESGIIPSSSSSLRFLEAATVGSGEAPGPPWLSLAQERPLAPWDLPLGVWPGYSGAQPKLVHVASS